MEGGGLEPEPVSPGQAGLSRLLHLGASAQDQRHGRCRGSSVVCPSYPGRSVKASQCWGRTTEKWRRSSVATFVSPRRSQVAITDASTSPSGSDAYVRSSSA